MAVSRMNKGKLISKHQIFGAVAEKTLVKFKTTNNMRNLELESKKADAILELIELGKRIDKLEWLSKQIEIRERAARVREEFHAQCEEGWLDYMKSRN